MKRYYSPLLLVVFLSLNSLLLAQSDSGNKGAEKESNAKKEQEANEAWNQLSVNLVTASSKSTTNPTSRLGSPAGSKASNRMVIEQSAHTDTAEVLVQKADQIQDFYNRYKDSSKASEAKFLRLRMITEAVRKGHESQLREFEKELKSYRKDSKFDIKDRYRIAASWDHVMASKEHANTEKPLSRIESVEKGLLDEFPELPFPYEALLRITNQSKGEDSIRIAQLVASSSLTPSVLKKEARLILKRHSLVGQNIAALLEPHVGSVFAQAQASNRTAIIYFWMSFSPVSIELAHRLTKSSHPGTIIIGINLDLDVAAGQQAAKMNEMPGLQYYDRRGFSGPIAEKLGISTVPLAFMTDKDGIIVSVTAHLDAAGNTSGGK